MCDNGKIESMRKYPSPNPNVRLDEITYWSCGLRIKGLLARPTNNIENARHFYIYEVVYKRLGW